MTLQDVYPIYLIVLSTATLMSETDSQNNEPEELVSNSGSTEDVDSDASNSTTPIESTSSTPVITHSHSHSHDAIGDWDILATHPVLKWIVGFLGLIAVLTVIGVVTLWPDGENRAEILDEARTIGLSFELHSAEVNTVTDEICSYSTPADPQDCRTVIITPNGGSQAGLQLVLNEFNLAQVGIPQVNEGDSIVVGFVPDQDFYFFVDVERRIPIIALMAFFIIVVLAMARARGGLAILAMASTVVIIIGFIGPSILNGNSPLLVAIVGASLIAFTSLYFTHGFTPTTTVALAGTMMALLITLGVSEVFFNWAGFTGFGNEAGVALGQLLPGIDLSSILLAGAVLGALGALDDITITQVATISELHEQNPSMTIRQLFTSGIKIGREHIASTVNTLLLAYAGASLPIILLSSARLNEDNLNRPSETLSQDLGPLSNLYRFFEEQINIANTEEIAVEVIRTLSGSIGLVAAVPVTTALAAILVGTKSR